MRWYRFIKVLFPLIVACIFVQCKPDSTPQENGVVKGNVWIFQMESPGAFKVELRNASDGSNCEVIYTAKDGAFSFDNVKPGRYYLTVTRDPYYWSYSVVDGHSIISTNSQDKSFEVKAGQTTTVDVYMTADELQKGDLDVLDLNGNPISEIHFSRNTSQIGFQLFNGKGDPYYWNIYWYDMCRATSPDGRDSAPWFTSISATEGVIQPGQSIGITCDIDQRIYQYQETGRCEFYIQIGFFSKTLVVSY